MIPYGRQTISLQDIEAVSEVLRGDWLTQGPMVERLENALAEYAGTKFAVVMSSGTAALEGAFAVLGIKPGDEIITTPITFAATANAALWSGAKVVFADIEAKTGLIDPAEVARLINSKTKAIAPVDYTGRAAALDKLKTLADQHNIPVVEDACQALGGSFKGKPIGAHNTLVTFSFHPVKNITTGEGGAVTTNDEALYRHLKRWVTHGISRDNFSNESDGPWYTEQQELAHNYRLTDLQCALGLSQLTRLDEFVVKRRRLVARYQEAFADLPATALPANDTAENQSAWHLYVARLNGDNPKPRRRALVEGLRAAGIGATVHHIPVYYHPYYQALGYHRGLCPVAEDWYERIVTLPLYPELTESDQDKVIKNVKRLLL